MPRGDGTGPMGMGPMTGRGAGSCVEYAENVIGKLNPTMGRGRGMGRIGFGRGFGGGGRGWRHQFFATGLPGWMRFASNAATIPEMTPDQERQALKAQADAMQSSLDSIKTRLAELGTGEDAKGK